MADEKQISAHFSYTARRWLTRYFRLRRLLLSWPKCFGRNGHYGAYVLAIPILISATEAIAVTATWTAGDGQYDSASNWSTDPVVPLNNGTTYDVVINGSGTDVTFDTESSGGVDSLSLGSGVTFRTDLALSIFSAAITMANDATFLVEDQSTLNLGGGNLDRSSLIVGKGFQGTGGAMLTTSVSSWAGTNGFNLDRTFSADGTGSVLDLSSLTSVERNGGSTTSVLSITATDSGLVDLSNLTDFSDNTSGVNGKVDISAQGTDSEIILSSLINLELADISISDTAKVVLENLAHFDGGTIEMKSTVSGAHDLHVSNNLDLGQTAVVDVADSTAAVVVGVGTPAGAVDGSLTVTSDGKLTGTGTVIGTLINQGHIEPGNSPGVLNVTGDFEQDTNAVLGIDIGGLAQGLEFDFLDISGSANLAGDVVVSLLDGYLASIGDSFIFLEADAGVSGMFEEVICMDCGGVAFEMVHAANFVSLNVVAAPVPLPPAVLFLLSGLVGIFFRGKGYKERAHQ